MSVYDGHDDQGAELGGDNARANLGRYVRRVLIAVGIVAAVSTLLLFAWAIADILLLAFAGLLLAIFLSAVADWLADHAPLTRGWALGLTALAIVGALALGGWFLAPTISAEVDQLSNTLPQSIQAVRQRIGQYRWSQLLLRQAPAPRELASSTSNIIGRLSGVFSTTLGGLANAAIIIFVGLYLAAEPQLYRGGLVRLAPIQQRPRAREVLYTLGYTLRWWLLGQMISMTVVGLLTGLGLWFIGAPFALILGIIAGLLEIIPTFGPILSAIPAVLVALVTSPTQALYVVLLYIGIQTVESYLLTPVVQEKAIALPPVITIMSVVAASALFGVLGLLLGAPLAATIMVLIKMLYVEDVLGDTSIKVHGEERAASAMHCR
jgi:predicted PurR-regulated permease PerM